MKIKSIKAAIPKRPGPKRSKGLHLSEVISSIDKALNISGYGSKHRDPDDDPELLFEMGFLWEEVLETALGLREVERPGEYVCDGIACSPDGIIYEKRRGRDAEPRPVIEEYKCTWKSCRGGVQAIQDNWRWMTQIKAYCFVVGAVKARLRVLYVNGDYSRPMRPAYQAYELRFSPEELLETWTMIRSHAIADMGLEAPE